MQCAFFHASFAPDVADTPQDIVRYIADAGPFALGHAFFYVMQAPEAKDNIGMALLG
jgi:hypothetical protein